VVQKLAISVVISRGSRTGFNRGDLMARQFAYARRRMQQQRARAREQERGRGTATLNIKRSEKEVLPTFSDKEEASRLRGCSCITKVVKIEK